MTNERTKRIESARAILDYLEEHPALPLPLELTTESWTIYTAVYFYEYVRQLVPCTKGSTASALYASRDFGRKSLRIWCSHSDAGCIRRVVGTHIEPAIPEREVEDVEWDCPASYLSLAK